MMCRVLSVSRSGYLNGQRRSQSLRNLEDFKRVLSIKAAHNKGRGVYGASKIQTELAEQGIHVGVNRIKRLRRLHGIYCIHKRKFKVTTQSNHKLPVAPNVLNQQFDDTTAPNQVWLADITYIDTDEFWLYLPAVKDRIRVS
jgi:putative transposase